MRMAPNRTRCLVPPSCLALLCVLSLGCAAGPASGSFSAPAAFYDYTVLVDPEASPPVATVTLEITGLARSPILAFPPGSTFAKLESPLIDGPVVHSGAPGELFPTDRRFAWRLESGPRVIVSWRVPHLVREASDEYEFPFIKRDHALLYTPTLLLLPDESAACRVRFVGPDGWRVRTPWGGRGATFRGTTAQLGDDYVLVGDWTERTVEVGEFVGTIAFAPDIAALADRVADRIAEVLILEFEMFGVEARGSYLVVCGPSPGAQLGGSPKRHSMVLAVDPALVARPPEWLEIEIVHLVAHEFHHTWTNGKPPLPDELRWYGEGFTDYMAWLICARLGLFDREAWHRQVASILEEVRGLGARKEVSLVEAGGDLFFEGGDAYSLVYGGGLLVALELDLALSEAGLPGGLEGFMRGFNNDPAVIERAPTLEEFLAAVEGVLGSTFRELLERRVATVGGLDLDRRNPLLLDPNSLWVHTVERTH